MLQVYIEWIMASSMFLCGILSIVCILKFLHDVEKKKLDKDIQKVRDNLEEGYCFLSFSTYKDVLSFLDKVYESIHADGYITISAVMYIAKSHRLKTDNPNLGWRKFDAKIEHGHIGWVVKFPASSDLRVKKG